MEGKGESERRANRSDVHLGKEEEARIEEETRDYFDELAPKRHTKPSRSEHSTKYEDALNSSSSSNSIPEFLVFQHLQSNQKVVNEEEEGKQGGGDEFVETEYYKDLNCIDKQHHTTGTGFIKMEDGKCFSLRPDNTAVGVDVHPSCTGNPATNDWIPLPHHDSFASNKPKRSDN